MLPASCSRPVRGTCWIQSAEYKNSNVRCKTCGNALLSASGTVCKPERLWGFGPVGRNPWQYCTETPCSLCVIHTIQSPWDRPCFGVSGLTARGESSRMLTPKSLCFGHCGDGNSNGNVPRIDCWHTERLTRPSSPSRSESRAPPMIKANYNDECAPVRKWLNPVVVHAWSLLSPPLARCDPRA